MEPVVDRIDDVYNAQVEFQRINADSQNGKAAFQAFGLLGHPSFVVINPEGEVLWTGLGEQTEEIMIKALQDILIEP